LSAVFDTHIRDLGLPKAVVEGDADWKYYYFPGKYGKLREVRSRRNPERQSGVCFGMGRHYSLRPEGSFGFGAFLRFSMRANRVRRIPFADLCRLLEQKVGDTDSPEISVATEESWVFLRTAWIPPDSDRFDIDSLEEAILRLPQLWPLADQWLAATWERLWPRGSGED